MCVIRGMRCARMPPRPKWGEGAYGAPLLASSREVSMQPRLLGLGPLPLVLGGLAIALAGLVIAYLLFGGGSDTPPPANPDPTATATLALGPAGFFGVESLPGEDWVMAPRQQLANVPNSRNAFEGVSPPIEECQALRDLENALYIADTGFRDGAVQEFERRTQAGGVAHIAHFVAEFASATELADSWEILKGIVADSKHLGCVVAAAALEDEDLAAEPLPPPTPPAGGLSAAMKYSSTISGLDVELTQVMVWWQTGATLSSLSIITVGAALSTADIESIVATAGGGS